MTTEEERLRRELRAMAALNRQLQAQIDDAAPVARSSRASRAGSWIEDLAKRGTSAASLARSQDGKVYVIEGGQRRIVRSGILAAGLEASLGESREAPQAELEGLDEGPPVELLEAPDGPPFVVVGGMRHTVRGVPLTYEVSNRQASEFASGEEINVAAANVSRLRYRQATTPQYQLGRLQGSLKKRGVVGTGKAAVKKVGRKLGR